jgi:hypothetical protein
VDGDEFSKAPRLARAAAEAVLATVRGAVFDPFHIARFYEHIVQEAQGIKSLGVILKVFDDLRSMPLLIPARTEEACGRIEDAGHGSDCGMLDLILVGVAQSALLRRETDKTAMVEKFAQAIADRFVITGRGGLIDMNGISYVQIAKSLMSPIMRDVARELVRRPNAINLGLSRQFRLTHESNLLGCAP